MISELCRGGLAGPGFRLVIVQVRDKVYKWENECTKAHEKMKNGIVTYAIHRHFVSCAFLVFSFSPSLPLLLCMSVLMSAGMVENRASPMQRS